MAGQAQVIDTVLNKVSHEPFNFSAAVPDGNYRVTVTLGNKKKAGQTVVRAESRRHYVDEVVTKKGKTATVSFVVNKHSPVIDSNTRVKLKPREVDYKNWDDSLNLSFCGLMPAVQHIHIEPVTDITTVFLCGNSTVVDQGKEPWASWGQMFTRWFVEQGEPVRGGKSPFKGDLEGLSIANYAESGLTATSFMAQNRLQKILSVIKEGDYVICEFGHNDEKEKGPGTGAWYHYTVALKKFVDMVRAKKGNIIFCTPTQRRFFDAEGKIKNTHGDFPAAMKAVAERENVPVIDLNAETKTLFEAMGTEGSKHLLVHYPMGTFPWQEKKFSDNTHFNPFGAYEVSKLVVMGLKRLNSPLVKHLSSDWTDFSPSKPDDWQTFYWPLSPVYDGKKPDGN
jgi:lysophospholipase L1-like esterase